MTNAELIAALRWCPTHGCSGCVALLEDGSCKYGTCVKMYEAAADALEEDDKRILKLEIENDRLNRELEIWASRSFEGKIGSMALKNFNLKDLIRELESQVPKEGEWIYDEYGFIRCSECRMEWEEPEHPQTNFCPNCGARMKGKHDRNAVQESVTVGFAEPLINRRDER